MYKKLENQTLERHPVKNNNQEELLKEYINSS